MVSSVRTPRRPQSTYEAPLDMVLESRQTDDEKTTEKDVSTRSLYSDHTVRLYVPSCYTSSNGPPKTVIHDPTYSDTERLDNNQSVSETSGDDDDHDMLKEINSLRLDNTSLRRQLVESPISCIYFDIS